MYYLDFRPADFSGTTSSMSIKLDSLHELNLIKGFKTVHLNIRSLVRKIELLRFVLINVDLDLICLTESWLKPDLASDLFMLDGFSLERNDRNVYNSKNTLKTGGGVCVYISDKYNYCVLPEMTVSNADIESLAIRINLGNIRSLLLLVIYRPPSGSIQSFLENLNDLTSIADCFNHRQDVIFLGDMNIYVSNESKSHDKAKLLSFCRTAGLEQLYLVRLVTVLAKTLYLI